MVLDGLLMLIVTEEDEPEPILDQDWKVEGEEDKYFSLLAQDPIDSVVYNHQNLPSHVKLPLVFRFCS